jgi:MFS family permease
VSREHSTSASPSFARYWTAAAISSFGSAVTTVAMPVLVVKTLHASPFEVGLVNAAQFLPYAMLGLVAGVYADRWRRKPVLVWGSFGRAVALGTIPLLWLLHTLTLWALVGLLLVFGAFSVLAFAATQSLLPRVVPRQRLVTANARLDQADTAAQTLGPALGGGLVGVLGAPVAVVVDAVSYLVEAVLVAGLHVEEPKRVVTRRRSLRSDVADGVRWGYGHRILGPLSVSTHVWFLANGAGFTALSVIALRELRMSNVLFGLLFAATGVTSLVGATVAPAVGRRIGSGPAILWSRAVYPLAWLVVAAAAIVPDGAALMFLALPLHGLVLGVTNPHEMGIRQHITPDELLGRVNATMRSANRTVAALGALLGGASVGLLGGTTTAVLVAAVFLVAVTLNGLSPLREVRGLDAA